MNRYRGPWTVMTGAAALLVGALLPWHLPLFHWRGSALDPRLALFVGAAVLLAAAASLRWAWMRVASIGWSSAALFLMLLTYANAPGSPGLGKALALAGAITALGGGVLGWNDVRVTGLEPGRPSAVSRSRLRRRSG